MKIALIVSGIVVVVAFAILLAFYRSLPGAGMEVLPVGQLLIFGFILMVALAVGIRVFDHFPRR